MRLSHQS